jgi:hypothetical protein
VLPIGFFMARTNATAEAQGQSGSFLSWMAGLYTALERIVIDNHGVATAALDAYAAQSHVTGPFAMNDIDGFGASVTQGWVDDAYARVYTDWDKNHPYFQHKNYAILCDAGHLGLAAAARYWRGGPEKVLVMGHTHDACLYGYPLGAIEEMKKRTAQVESAASVDDQVEQLRDLVTWVDTFRADASSSEALWDPSYIYVNSGTWVSIDNKPATYAVVEDKGSHHLKVSTHKYLGGGQSKTIDQAEVKA